MKAGIQYQKNELTMDGISLRAIAEKHGTPLYVYSGETIRRNYRRIADAFSKTDAMIAYSVKSSSNLALLALLAKEGAGFDIVSGGELERVLRIGIKGGRVIFAGVGKSENEMRAALRADVREFNLESEGEAERLNAVAASMKRTAPVALRVNPDVDAKTHKYITTGKAENKFGISMERAVALAQRITKEFRHLRLEGLHCHVGSQILDSAVHPRVVKRVVGLAERIMAETGGCLRTLNFGGGFGIAYREGQKPLDLRPFAKVLIPQLKRLGVSLILEPGRSIVAAAGVLLTRVEYIKRGDKKTFVIIDGSMSELIRPTLYEAWHEIIPVTRRAGKKSKVDFVGPVCESSDFFAKDRDAVVPEPGDLLCVKDAGAYGMVMASNYNTRPLPAEVLVDGGKVHLVRRRETYDEMLGLERVP